MRRIAISLVFVIAGLNRALFADSLPPIGKREYFLNHLTPSEPVDIQPIRPERPKILGEHMRDPLTLRSALIDRKLPSEARISTPKRLSTMKFERASIKGRYLVPRVTFDRPVLNIGRREAPLEVGYRKKVGESEGELRAFDW